jgi:hypothetical protein
MIFMPAHSGDKYTGQAYIHQGGACVLDMSILQHLPNQAADGDDLFGWLRKEGLSRP